MFTQISEAYIDALPKPPESILLLIREYKLKAYKDNSFDMSKYGVSRETKLQFLLALAELLDALGYYTDEIKTMPRTDDPETDVKNRVQAMCNEANCWIAVQASGLWLMSYDQWEKVEQSKMQSYMAALDTIRR